MVTLLLTVLVINHLLLPWPDSSMSLDVFLSFRRCPKHPNTPPFEIVVPQLPNLATHSRVEIGGDRNEIECKFRGAKAE